MTWHARRANRRLMFRPFPEKAAREELSDKKLFVPARLRRMQEETNNNRVWNFSAGPSKLSDSVMRRAQKEFSNFEKSGMGFIEMSHRDANGPVQMTMVRCQKRIKDLLEIKEGAKEILLMPGGAHLQFSAVPMNLIGSGRNSDGQRPKVGYVDTGYWSMRAAEHAAKYADCHVVCENRGYLKSPEESWVVPADLKYVHVCLNETIAGLEYFEDPDPAKIQVVDPADHSKKLFNPDGSPMTMKDCDIPLIADATSTLMSRPVKTENYGVIFASSGKNLGPAGICVVIVDKELLVNDQPGLLHTSVAHDIKEDRRMKELPQMLDWSLQASSMPIQNIYNTPPTFNAYMLDKILEEYQQDGGLEEMAERAKHVADIIYDYLADSQFYDAVVNGRGVPDRSRMNICFQIRQNESRGLDERLRLERNLTVEAAEVGIHQLMGHPIFGGLRITSYNAMPEAAVRDAVDFLQFYEEKHGQ